MATKHFLEKTVSDSVAVILFAIILTVSRIIGTITIPIVSEKLFDGKRASAILCCFSLKAICFCILKLIFKYDNCAIIDLDDNVIVVLTYIAIAFSGIGISGFQIMAGGIAAVETTSKEVSATVSEFIGVIGYVGAILSSGLGGNCAELWLQNYK